MGHPKHDVLFFAKQALEPAGLQMKAGASYYAKSNENYFKIKDLFDTPLFYGGLSLDERESTRPLWIACRTLKYWNVPNTWLATEAGLYQTLLRGHSPQTEPFRKWVTEEVLPSTRRAGSYDITKSETQEAKAFSEQNADITGLITTVKALQAITPQIQHCE